MVIGIAIRAAPRSGPSWGMRRLLFVYLAVSLLTVGACSDSNGTGTTDGGSVDVCSTSQVAGDCLRSVCDADGAKTIQPDDSDVPARGECGAEKCQGGLRVAGTQEVAGTPCSGGLCDGRGACVSKLGDACASNEQCPSGFCSDGVCCLESCTGECKACNIAGSKGLCRNIAYLEEDSTYQNADGVTVNCTTAVGGARCNGTGKCLRSQGTACVDDATCMSNNCSAGNQCLGAPGELCNALADCASNQCVMGACM
jgi:hypothetical protein